MARSAAAWSIAGPLRMVTDATTPAGLMITSAMTSPPTLDLAASGGTIGSTLFTICVSATAVSMRRGACALTALTPARSTQRTAAGAWAPAIRMITNYIDREPRPLPLLPTSNFHTSDFTTTDFKLSAQPPQLRRRVAAPVSYCVIVGRVRLTSALVKLCTNGAPKLIRLSRVM